MQQLKCYKELPVSDSAEYSSGLQESAQYQSGYLGETDKYLKCETGRFAMLEKSGVVQSEHVFTPEQQPPIY